MLWPFHLVLPLQLILSELYFFELKKKQIRLQWTTIITIFLFTLIMIAGIYGTLSYWIPKVAKILGELRALKWETECLINCINFTSNRPG